MRTIVLTLAALLAAAPALAQELPKSPKAAPPEPLPEPECDVSLPNNGQWLLGRWVGPYAKWEFARDGQAIGWKLERKGTLNEQLGWRDGAVIDGRVEGVTGCTLRAIGAEGDATGFVFEGVLSDGGKIYGFATNKAGKTARFVLRRER